MVLYSTDCPMCKILKAKLNKAGVKYEICSSVSKMRELGMVSAPALLVDDKLMNFKEAIDWLAQYNKEGECKSCRSN